MEYDSEYYEYKRKRAHYKAMLLENENKFALLTDTEENLVTYINIFKDIEHLISCFNESMSRIKKIADDMALSITNFEPYIDFTKITEQVSSIDRNIDEYKSHIQAIGELIDAEQKTIGESVSYWKSKINYCDMMIRMHEMQ